MAREVYSITGSALPHSARVAGFRGTEAISRLYEMHVFILVGSDGNDLELDDVVGTKAKLVLSREDGRPGFLFHGIFAAFELLHEFGDRSLFHGVLVPQLWQLTQTFHSRIWTKKTITDIIKEVLEDSLSSDDYALHLSHAYPVEEHVCQYAESNFAFISRWMEREGMYYYFEQGDDSEKLIISDDMSFQTPLDLAPVRFFATSGGHDASSGEALHTFTCTARSLPATVKLRDYDYAKPKLVVSGEAPVSKVGLGEINVYGSRFFTPDDGKRIAKIRAEELLARKSVYRGTGTEFHLRSGYQFTLEDHPRAAWDQKYLAIAVEHTGNQQITTPEMRALTGIPSDRVYWVEVSAIAASVQFRAESSTPWPRIYGFENGTVCGAVDSDYAQIDDAGRYNVKFKFDESTLKDGKASTFVRMMQPHGGSPEGFHFPLRKGTEVVFTFLGGDPDRPVIAGVVNDAHNPSPVTKGNHTLNVLQTGARNRWELEDKSGQERITMITPHEQSFIRMGYPNKGHTMIVQTNKATLLNAGSDLDIWVGLIEGKGSWDSQVKNHWTSYVQDGGFTLAVGTGNLAATNGQIDIKSTKDINIETQTGNHTFKVDKGTATTTIKGDTTLHVTTGKHMVNIDTGDSTTTIKAGNTTIDTQAGTTHIHSKGKITIDSPDDIEITGKNVHTTSTADKKYNILGDQYSYVNGNTQKLTIGNSKAITIGTAQTATIGATASLFVGLNSATKIGGEMSTAIGIAINTFVGGKVQATLAAEAYFTAALKLQMEASVTIAITAALKLEHKAAGVKAAQADLESTAAKLHLAEFFGILPGGGA
jgi:type VI secretion system secreted protein VgrG